MNGKYTIVYDDIDCGDKENEHICIRTVKIVRTFDNAKLFSYKVRQVVSCNTKKEDRHAICENYLYKSITFFMNDGVQYAICNDCDGPTCFGPAIIINLETLETHTVEHGMKCGYTDINISEKNKIIVLYGYDGGMSWGDILFDFEGNEIYDFNDVIQDRTKSVDSKYLLQSDQFTSDPFSKHTNEETIVTIIRKSDGEKIFTYQLEDYYHDNDDQLEHINDSITFFSNEGVDFAIINIKDDRYSATLLNLETFETKQICHDMTNGYGNVEISEKNKIMLFSGRIYGMRHGSVVYDFNGNKIVSWKDLKMCPTKYTNNGIGDFNLKVINDELVLQLTFNCSFFDRILYPHITPTFKLEDFGTNIKTVDNSGTKKYILSCYQYPDIDLVDFSCAKKLMDFIKECQNYDRTKNITEDISKNPDNMFKFFIENKDILMNNLVICKDQSNHELLSQFTQKCSQFKFATWYGLYTGNNFSHYLEFFARYKFNLDTFGTWLANNTLGHEYHSNKCIRKETLPNGVGMSVTFTTFDNISYEFTIKMYLIELENDNTKVTYSKEKSIVTVNIRTFTQDCTLIA